MLLTIENNIETLTDIAIAIVNAGMVLRIIIIFQHTRTEDEGLKSGINKACKVFMAGILANCTVSLTKAIVFRYFDNINNLYSLKTKVVLLLTDGAKALCLIDAAIIAILEMTTLIKWMAADEHDRAKYIRRAGTILLTGCIILCASGLIAAVLSYY